MSCTTEPPVRVAPESGPEAEPPLALALPEDVAAEVRALVERHGRGGDAILPALEALERALGPLADAAFRAAGRLLGVRPADLKELALTSGRVAVARRPAHALVVCVHRHCAARGAGALLDALREERGLRPDAFVAGAALSLETVRCLGACKLGPNVLVDGACWHAVRPRGLLRLVDSLAPRRSAATAPAQAALSPSP